LKNTFTIYYFMKFFENYIIENSNLRQHDLEKIKASAKKESPSDISAEADCILILARFIKI